MTVAYDTASDNYQAVNPQAWTHTPVGTPKSVTVFIVHAGASTLTSSVTYGGVALAQKRSAADSGAVPGRVEAWHLGAGVPTGAKTVSISRTQATTLVHAVVVTHTAADDVEVVTSSILQGDQTDPSATLGYGSRTCHALSGLFCEKAGVLGSVEITGVTRILDKDLGAGLSGISVTSRQTTPGVSDFTIGYTSALAGTAFVALALSEVQAVDPTVFPVASIAGSSAPRSPAWLSSALRAVKTLPQLTALLGMELTRFSQSVTCYERVAILPYGTTVRPGGDVSRWSQINVVNATAFTIANPGTPREGVELSLDIWNSSAGAMGAITWGSEYELQAAFTNPATLKHRLISFYRAPDGLWRERFRSSADLS